MAANADKHSNRASNNYYAPQQCLFSPEIKEQILGIMNSKLQMIAHERSAEVAALKKRIDGLNAAQNNLTASLEQGQATKTIMNKMDKNEAEIADLVEQLEAKSMVTI